MRTEKQIVRDYYDRFGWRKDPIGGSYNDTRVFVDTRPVLARYQHGVRVRMRGFLRPSGEYFLDAGSGAIAHPDTLDHSSGYRWRVCVDLSSRALAEARAKLEGRGMYVKGDLTRLPFRDGTFAGSLCEHVLYHVPKDEQGTAIQELHRTLQTGGRGIIVYMWPTSPMTRLAVGVGRLVALPRRVTRKLWSFAAGGRRVSAPGTGPPAPDPEAPPLYVHAHDRRWLASSLPKEWKADVRCWRSADRTFTASLVPDNFLGRWMLGALLRLESTWPHAFARLGRYPMIILEK